ncbi:hypothetical protein NM208_g15819 [Fusarium decemcellulare]|uniref:Uncharacterized protein n=1 Tax=Fusarium decemcellulare TaxID=57161 RepID=A0ACC1RD69_9HYPO|nr:hypothetical protein NM208_g15819 [Fusarium decemcellulare]
MEHLSGAEWNPFWLRCPSHKVLALDMGAGLQEQAWHGYCTPQCSEGILLAVNVAVGAPTLAAIASWVLVEASLLVRVETTWGYLSQQPHTWETGDGRVTVLRWRTRTPSCSLAFLSPQASSKDRQLPNLPIEKSRGSLEL